MDMAGFLQIIGLAEAADVIKKVDAQIIKTLHGSDKALAIPAKRMLAAGGKRLRPTLLIASANCKQKFINKDVIIAAAAIEMVHLGSLVHDDIIDKSPARRGVASVNYKEGLSTAILVGDFLMSSGCALAAKVNHDVTRTLATATALMCEGQNLEFDDNYRRDIASKIYLTSIGKKSGSLISAACAMGGQCAGFNKIEIEALASYGESFGMAFQIVDDLVDGDFGDKSAQLAHAKATEFAQLAYSALGVFASNKIVKALADLPLSYIASTT